ncbi:MAG: response regulator [Nitrospirae bacterium]|nr:response regulator [Nitrospirota bacterium]
MNRTVLIIDDEMIRMGSYIDRIKRSGTWNVEKARRLSEASHILKSKTIDVVILDINMPFDEQLTEKDWNLIKKITNHTGVALYNYLLREELLINIPVLVYTSVDINDIKPYFIDGSNLSIVHRMYMTPMQLLNRINNIIEEHIKK